jgi:CMP-2-keto-3-deoxyoctulosonic acid synthetase
MCEAPTAPAAGVDTPDDLERVRRLTGFGATKPNRKS